MKMRIAFFLLFAPFLAMAQSPAVPVEVNRWMQWQQERPEQTPEAYRSKAFAAENLVPSLKSWAVETFDEIRSPNALKLVFQKETPLGNHFTFVQRIDGVTIKGTELRLSLGREYTLDFVHHKLALPHSIDADWPEGTGDSVLFYDGIEFQPARAERIKATNGLQYDRYRLSNGGVFYVDPARRKEGPGDSLANVLVFIPDPITSAETTYGGFFKNNDDQDNDSLNAQRKARKVEVRYEAGEFTVSNSWVNIVNPAHKNFEPARSTVDSFYFTRSQLEFEQVNALYHITTYQKYMQDLGLDYANYAIPTNTRAFEEDQSRFYPHPDIPGIGNVDFGYHSQNRPHVDDAEDADVILHEYGHAISYSANGNNNLNKIRQSIDEGICDYFACAYSRGISEYSWEKLFNWDGHNEFWSTNLRYCVSEKKAEDFSLTKSIYDNGEIIAATFMEIWETLGAKTADELILNSIALYSDNMAFVEVADYLLYTDSVLFEEAYRDTLCSIFTNRGFVDENLCFSSTGAEISRNLISVDASRFALNSSLGIKLNKPESAFFQLYDSQGRTIASGSLKNDSWNRLQFGQLSAGMYVLRIKGPSLYYTRKLIR